MQYPPGPDSEDATDPLGSAPGFSEQAAVLFQADHIRLESVGVQTQGGGSARHLRLSVLDKALADRLRAFLLEGAEDLTGFRDLLADDASLAAVLEPFDFTLSAASSASAPLPPRLADLRDTALWLLRLGSQLDSHGLWFNGCQPEHLGFSVEGLALAPRFLGWTGLREGSGPDGWTTTEVRGALLPAARYCRERGVESGMSSAVAAADSLIAALESSGHDAMQATLERLTAHFLLQGATDTGRRRSHNEDAWLALHLEQHSSTGVELALAAVADGMGGHAAGEVASSLALDLLRGSLATSLLLPRTRPHETQGLAPAIHGAILSAAAAIAEKARLDVAAAGMGTTLAGLACMRTRSTAQPGGEESGCVFWTGDSRVYLLDYTGLRQLSHDHSLVQTLLDSGQVDAEAAWNHPQKNVVTRCLGGGPGSDARPEVLPFRLGPGEIALICSDGLSDALRDSEIEAAVRSVMKTHTGPATPGLLEVLSATLITAANAAGGPDNISVVLLAG